jgi:hypothetical protein
MIKSDSSFSSLSFSELATVAGAKGRDPGVDYVHRLGADLRMQGGHEHAAVNAARKHHWYQAGKEALTAAYDEGHTITDAVRPFKGAWGVVKDAAGIFGAFKK